MGRYFTRLSSRILRLAPLLVIALLLPTESDALEDKPPSSGLMHDLVTNYGPTTVRPVYNTSHATGVAIRIFVTQIIELKWKDEFLAWNSSDYPGVERLYIAVRDIWTPDITLYTNVDEFFERTKNIPTIVTPDGMVSWNFPAILKSACQIDTLMFPFDVQRCDLIFASWVYTIVDIDLFKDVETQQNLSDYFVPNGVWELSMVEVYRKEIPYPCCPDPFPMVTFSLHLSRRPLHYILSIILPAVLLAVISLSIYVLPPDSGEKISLGVTTLLALLLFQELISGSLPPSSERTPIIGYFFTPMVVIGCTSVLSSVFVLNLHHRGSHRPVPHWLRYLVFRVLAPILCYRRGAETLNTFHQATGPTRSSTIIESWPRTSANNILEPSCAEGLLSSPPGHESSENLRGNGEHAARCGEPDNIQLNRFCDSSGARECCHCKCCREMVKTVEKLRDSSGDGNGREPSLREWCEVALILDRFMLLVSALTMMASITLTILLFIIHGQRSTLGVP